MLEWTYAYDLHWSLMHCADRCALMLMRERQRRRVRGPARIDTKLPQRVEKESGPAAAQSGGGASAAPPKAQHEDENHSIPNTETRKGAEAEAEAETTSWISHLVDALWRGTGSCWCTGSSPAATSSRVSDCEREPYSSH
jgi:hypothetical protein